MEPLTLEGFAEHRIGIALRLGRGEAGAGYLEGFILLSALISGLAATAWPGRGIDQKRFVELLVRFSDPGLRVTRVSVPLLLRDLKRRSDATAAYEGLVRSRPGHFGDPNDVVVLTGDDVDQSPEVACANSGLPLLEVRAYSYATILYRQARNSALHEYILHEDVTSHPMTFRPTPISYSNLIDKIVPADEDWGIRRLIHFDLEWIAALARSAAKHVVVDSPHAKPATWWLEGAAG